MWENENERRNANRHWKCFSRIMSGNVECKGPYFAETIGLDTQNTGKYAVSISCWMFETKSADFQIANKLFGNVKLYFNIYCYWEIPI